MPEITRREILQNASAFGITGMLAGCLESSGNTGNEENTSTKPESSETSEQTDSSVSDTTMTDFKSEVDSPDSAKLEFTANLDDSTIIEEDPAVITIAVQNIGDTTIEILSGAPAPFGVLAAESPAENGTPLWSDAYEESEHVEITSEGLVVEDIGLVTTLDQDERVEEFYELRRSWLDVQQEIPVQSGDYRIENELAYRLEDNEEKNLQYTLQWSVEGSNV